MTKPVARRRLRASVAGIGALAALAACGGAPAAPTAAPAKPAEAPKPAAAAPTSPPAAATPAEAPKPAEKPSTPAAAASATSGGQETVITMWTSALGEPRFPARGAIFGRWGKEHNARFQIEDLPAGPSYNQKLAAASVAKLLPDLIHTPKVEDSPDFASQGFLVDVDDLVREIGRDDFFAPAITFGIFKSKLYGVPLVGVPILMHFRKDWLEEEKVAPPADWAGLTEVGQKLHGKTKGGVEIAAISGYFATVHANVFYQNFIGPNNGFTFDQKGSVVVNSPEVRQAMQQIKDLTKFYQAGYVNMSYGDTATQFADGKLAIHLGSTTVANLLVKGKPEIGAKSSAALLPWGPSSKKDRAATTASTTWRSARSRSPLTWSAIS